MVCSLLPRFVFGNENKGRHILSVLGIPHNAKLYPFDGFRGCRDFPKTKRLIPIRLFPRKKRVAAEMQLHSDQGFQYTSHGYFNLTQSYGITPSMSSKGNPYDNAMAENFFSILKTECMYRHQPKTLAEASDLIDRYIYFYNHERIQNKTGVAPLTLRHSA